jgi:hypothetical protein
VELILGGKQAKSATLRSEGYGTTPGLFSPVLGIRNKKEYLILKNKPERLLKTKDLA